MNEYIAKTDVPIIALVGRNGEGKSFSLDSLLSKSPNNSIYISEEGIVKILYQKNKIVIDNKKHLYVYTNEKSRGSSESDTEQQTINRNSINVIKFCNKIINNLTGIKNKSQGQKKLQNIMEIFLNYNLNNIEYILFDEPENFLDEEYLKIIAQLLNLLADNNFKIRLATHNSRLLHLLNLPIENIILISNRTAYQISLQAVKDIFIKAAELIEAERIQKKYNEDASIKYKLCITGQDIVFSNFIESNLKSIEFYRSLFYKEIIIVEGQSDMEALNSIKHTFDNSVTIYSSNGKAWIPFYALLFNELDKKVTVIIDVDPNNNNHSTAITTVLENINEIKVVKHNPDLEQFYGIDINSIGNTLGMTSSIKKNNRGWLKQIAAYSHFRITKNRETLAKHIFEQDMEIYKFN